jgi:hypothetical protein
VKVYKLSDAGVMVKDVESQWREAAFRGLVAAGHRTVEHIVADVIPSFGDRMPVDRGAYRADWRVQPVKAEWKVVVVNTAPHAVFIEHGVRAANVKIGRKMIEALAEWVKRRGLGSRTVTSSSGRVRRVKASNAEAMAMAWAIARSMQSKGIFNRNGEQGLGVLRKAGRRIPEFIKDEVERELHKLK